MTTPLLSILIPTIPTRRVLLSELWDSLEKQVQEHPIELVALLDNKKRTIGAKRQALLDVARGEYIAFVDDDDAVAPDYASEIINAITTYWPDLITFGVQVTINHGTPGIVYLNAALRTFDEFKPGAEIQRPPHELAVWRRSIATTARFADMNTREDYAWASQLWNRARNPIDIPKILYYYRTETVK